MVDGQWSMVDGQWSMVSGVLALTTDYSPLNVS